MNCSSLSQGGTFPDTHFNLALCQCVWSPQNGPVSYCRACLRGVHESLQDTFVESLKTDLIVNSHGQHGASCEHDGSYRVQAKPYPARGGDEAKPPGPVAVQVAQERLIKSCPRVIRPDGGQPLSIPDQALNQSSSSPITHKCWGTS